MVFKTKSRFILNLKKVINYTYLQNQQKKQTEVVQPRPQTSQNVQNIPKTAKQVRFQEQLQQKQLPLHHCPFCEKIFSTSNFLKNHITSVHRVIGQTGR